MPHINYYKQNNNKYVPLHLIALILLEVDCGSTHRTFPSLPWQQILRHWHLSHTILCCESQDNPQTLEKQATFSKVTYTLFGYKNIHDILLYFTIY